MYENDSLRNRQNGIDSTKKPGEKSLMDNVFKEDMSNTQEDCNDSREESDMEEAYYNDFKKRPPSCTAKAVSLLSNLLQSSEAALDTDMKKSSSETSLPESLKQHIALEHSHSVHSLTRNSKPTGKGEINENSSSWNDNFSRW